MGSGLIWAGIGKGIADAGTTYGNAMFRAAESELADQRAMQKAEALERLKDKMAEERSQRDADIFGRAQTRAGEMAATRKADQLETDSGKLASNAMNIAGDSPAMTQDEMKRHLEGLNPAERKALEGTGLIGRAASPMRQELQTYDDTIAAARELGASSTMIKSLQDAKKERLAEIKAEFKEEGDKEEREQNRRRLDQQDRRLDQMSEYQGRMAGAAERRAGAAEISANRPRGGGSDGDGSAKVRSTKTDADGNVIAIMSDGTTKQLGIKSGDYNKSVANLIAQREKNDYQFKQLPEEEKRSWATGRLTPGAPTQRNGDNSGSRPPLSSFMR